MPLKESLRLNELRIITKCYRLAFQIRYNIYDDNRNKREYERVAKALADDLLKRKLPLAKNRTDEIDNDADYEDERQKHE
jgi:hypothetical protein